MRVIERWPKSAEQPWKGYKARLLPVKVRVVPQSIQAICTAVLQQKAATDDEAASKDHLQTTWARDNQHLRQSDPISKRTIPERSLPLGGLIAVTAKSTQEGLILEDPAFSDEAHLRCEYEHRLVSEFINEVSTLLLKHKRKEGSPTSLERESLIKYLYAIIISVKRSDIHIFLSVDGPRDDAIHTSLVRDIVRCQPRQMEMCHAQENHLTMYCEHWLRKLAGKQWLEKVQELDASVYGYQPTCCKTGPCVMLETDANPRDNI